ncbi:MAG: multidrug efflux MFS transporter [Microbacterium sp.]|uniref:MDR family MFS transporter n=1 Tax=Microbacterium sp. TaxID=51671 RepID=UPI001AD4F284|nr:MDR family MFS transporter [Microbacterium sp.]MBN9177249.1 multidrug efflux MFS transporter [Microbacterium sp.]
MSVNPVASSDSTAAVPRSAIVTALVLVVGGLAVIFDSTIMSIALKTLAADLDVPITTIQWVTTGYLLALGVAIPVVGWAQSRLGGKRLWMIALTIFLLASIACSLSWDATSLIAFRIVQGLGGGLMMPLMATLAIQQVPRGANLGRLMATVSLPAALGPILGPVVGGLILAWADWRWLFWVNVPFCVIGLLLAWKLIPADPPHDRVRLDGIGLLLVSPGLVGILYGLSNVSQDGGFGRADVWAPLAAGLVLTVAFVLFETRTARTGLIDVSLLRRRSVGSASAVMFLSGASLYGSMLLLPLFFQVVHGVDALGAALLLIPQGVGALLSRTLAGRLTDAIGAKIVAVAGFVVMGAATAPFALADASTNPWWLAVVLGLRGFGMGAVMIPVMSVGFVGLTREEVPHASILTRLAQQLGGAFGTALLAVILDSAVAGATDLNALADGFDVAFWWAVGFTVVAIAVCFALPSKPPSPPSAEAVSLPRAPRSRR